MAIESSLVGIESVEDAFFMLQGGQHIVVCAPSNDLTLGILRRCAPSAAKKKAVLISLTSLQDESFRAQFRSNFCLSSHASLHKALHECKTSLSRVARETLIVVEVSATLPVAFAEPGKDEELIKGLERIFGDKNFSVAWFVRRDALSLKTLVTLKETVDYFLDISRVGTQTIAQFITAKGIYSQEFFLPRTLTLSATSASLSHPRILQVSSDAFSPGTEQVSDDMFNREYKQIFDTVPEGMILFELWGDFKEFNTRAKEALGYTENELSSLRFADLIEPGKHFGTLRSLRILKKKGKLTFTTQVRRKSGRTIDLEISASSVGRNVYVAVCRDSTERVKSDAEARSLANEYHAFVSALPYPYAIFINRKLAVKNGAFDKLFPWLAEKAPSVSDFFGRRNAEVLKEISSMLDESATDAHMQNRELLFPAPERQTVAAEVSISVLQYEGKQALYCTFVDVSDRRKVLDKAEAVEEKFKTLLEQSFDAIAIAQDDQFTLVNATFVEMFGYLSALDILGKEITAVVSGRKGRVEILDSNRRRVQGESIPSRYEYTGVKKDGSKISVEAEANRITIEGHPAILTYHRDITKQQKKEEDFFRKTKGWEILNHISDEVSSAASLADIYQRGMNAAMKGAQFDIAALFQVEPVHRTLNIILHRDVSENILSKLSSQSLDDGFARFFNKTHEPVVVTIAEYPPYLHYKSLFETEEYKTLAFLPLVVKGQLYSVLMLATKKDKLLDDSDRVLLASLTRQLSIAVEKALLSDAAREAEQLFHATVKNISDVVYTLQPNGTFDYISPNVEKLIGFIPPDFSVNAGLWRTLLHPDDRPSLSLRISNQSQTLNEFQLEYRILPKGKATYTWLHDNVRYTRDANGNVDAIHGVLHDITDRKRLAEIAGGEKTDETLLDEKRNVVQNLPDGIALFDNDLKCIEWNIALEKITGVAHSDAIGKILNDLPAVSPELRSVIERSLDNGEEVVDEISYTIPYAEESGDLHVRISPWRGASGERIGTIVMMSNVTVLRNLRRDVSESEETLRRVIDAMGDALVISDLQGQIWEVNNAFTQLTGYARSEVRLTTFPYPWLVDAEMAHFIRWIAELNEKHHLHDLDMMWRHKDGYHVGVSLNTTLLRNGLGEPTAILSIARDITDRRRLSLELEWKNRQIELLNKIISYANTTLDLERIFETIAREVHALVAYEGMGIAFLDEEQHLTPWYLAVPSDSGESLRVKHLPVDATTIYDAVRTGEAVIKNSEAGGKSETRSQITIPLSVNDKALGAFSLISSLPFAFSVEELSFLQPVADEIGAIIQRVQLFQQVSDDSSYIHNLLNSINNVVYTVDANCRITETNKAWREFMIRQGLEEFADEEKIIGSSLESVVRDPDLWNHYKRVIDDLFSRRIEYYSRDFEIAHNGTETAYHLVINPMIINNKVTALVFTHTDITEINRTEAEIKRRNKELIALNAIATSINKSLETESVLRVAAEQLKEAFDATMVAFYLVDEEEKQLVLSRYLGIPEELAATIASLDISSSLTGHVITTRKPIYVSDGVSDDPRVTDMGRRLNAAIGLRSLGLVPLQSKDKMQGAFLISFSKSHIFTEKEQQLLLLIGNQIGSALENAHLYAEIQHQVQTLTTLYELGKGLTGLLDLNSMLQSVYREVARALPLERFYYQAYSREHNTLSLLSRTINGVAEFYPAGVKVRSLRDWPNTIYQEVVAKSTSYLGTTGGALSDSMIAVPIKAEDTVVGIVSIVSSLPRLYNSVHLRLLESIANLTGVAIGKATLYEDTLRKSSEIENRNKELDDFTYVVSHDLKEPLISIEGYSKIVMKDYQEKLDDEGREYLGAVVQSTARMKHLIDDLLTLSRLGRMHEAYESVSVRRIIDEILHDLQFTLREKNVVVTVAENLPFVRYSSTRLSMVFRNLIANAMKFNGTSTPTVDIGVREDDNEYTFFVADNGIGIEPQYFERIFTIFQRLKRSEEYRGTGAGLTIAKKIVEREGGRIWVESVPELGSTFFFTIKKPA